MAYIANQGFYNFQNDETRITVIGHDLTTDKIDAYSAVISAQDAVTGFPKDNLLGRLQEVTTLHTTKGRIANQTTQNDMENTAEGTLTIWDDSVYETLKTTAKSWRNALHSMLLCEQFAANEGGNIIKPLGVGGNVVLDSTGKILKNKDWKNIFKKDAELKIAYTTATQDNIFLGARNNRSLSVILEMKCDSNAGDTKVVRYIICAGNASGSEADDKNTDEFTVYFLSDFEFYDGYFIEGISSDYSDATDSETISEIRVDYFKEGSAVADPTDFGNSGDLLAIVDTDTMTLTIKESDGATTWTDITGTLVDGAKVFAPMVTTTDISAATAEFTYITVKTGALAGGVVMGTTVTDTDTYTLGTTAGLNCFEFNFLNKAMEKVTSLAQI